MPSAQVWVPLGGSMPCQCLLPAVGLHTAAAAVYAAGQAASRLCKFLTTTQTDAACGCSIRLPQEMLVLIERAAALQPNSCGCRYLQKAYLGWLSCCCCCFPYKWSTKSQYMLPLCCCNMVLCVFIPVAYQHLFPAGVVESCQKLAIDMRT